MKTIFLLILSLCLAIMLQAQVSKTVEVTAGNLDSLLTATELNTITSLTLTGTIDARDFKTMRDSMPHLAQLELSDVSVLAYSGWYGTATYTTSDYEANEIPEHALGFKSSLTTLVLPSSITVINGYAFTACRSLTTVVIPSMVTIIKEGVFSDCYALTSITIPSTVTTISDNTFNGCTALTSFTIPSSVTTIGERAFYGCTSLASLTIPSSVTFIGDYALYACISLTSLTIPPSLTSIGESTFSSLSALTSLTIPSSVTSIGIRAFNGCSSLTSVSIPSSVTTIGEAAFRRCSNLASLTIPSSITSISDYTFSYCEALTSVTIPSSVTSIGRSAFAGCTHLASLQIPSSVTRIGDSAFDSCSSLTEIILPPSLIFLGNWVFGGCRDLKSIHIPSSVSRIGSYVFADDDSLRSVYMERSVPVELDSSAFSDKAKSNGTLFVPYGSKALYSAANEWKEFKNIEEDTAGFMLSANTIQFDVKGGQTSLNIRSTVPWEANSNQSWVTITPASGTASEMLTVTAQANDLTANRTGKITITGQGVAAQIINVTQKSDPEVVTVTAGNLSYLYTKEEKDTLTRLTLSGFINAWDIKSIDEEMPLLTYLDLTSTSMKGSMNPNGDIDRAAYFYPDNWMPGPTISYDPHLDGHALNKPLLRELKLPSTLEVIGCFAFLGCSGLNSVTIPTTVKQIGYKAFADCKSLTSVTLPSSLTGMDWFVFYNCSGLTTVKIEAGLKYISNGDFAGCSALHSIILPESLIEIADGAFSGCTGLDSIYSYNPTPPSANEKFTDVNKSSCIVYVPIGSRPLYAAAEGWKDFKNIVEMSSFSLSDTILILGASINSSATITIHTTGSWHTTSDQQWLTITPASGNADQILTITAQANTMDSARMATVTVLVPGAASQTIIITQKGITVGLDKIEANTTIKYFPNPFTQQMTIAVANPLNKEITADIYNLKGQKIKSLAKARNDKTISLTWDGNDEKGQKVPEGMYLLRVNGEVSKVVKR